MSRQKLEEKLYAPIVETLKKIYDYWYLDRSQVYSGKPNDKNRLQYSPSTEITNPHLEITAHGEFSEDLKLHNFDYYMFKQLSAEELHPDVMGYVRKNTQKKSSPIEVITVEVKAGDLKLRDLMQAKLYETFFNSTHTFLLSPNGMAGETIEVALKYEQVFRGNVIIGKCGAEGKDLRIDPRLANKIPKELTRFCRL
jgi:hypothetical protein